MFQRGNDDPPTDPHEIRQNRQLDVDAETCPTLRILNGRREESQGQGPQNFGANQERRPKAQSLSGWPEHCGQRSCGNGNVRNRPNEIIEETAWTLREDSIQNKSECGNDRKNPVFEKLHTPSVYPLTSCGFAID
jgi:hypothetical protein